MTGEETESILQDVRKHDPLIHPEAEAAEKFYIILDDQESLLIKFPLTVANQEIVLHKTGREYIYAAGPFNTKRDATIFLNGISYIDYPDSCIVTKSDFNYLLQPSVLDTLEIRGPYTVQLLALRGPLQSNLFHPSDAVTMIEGSDGFYRYTSGLFTSYTEAQKTLAGFVKRGFIDAFIRQVPGYAGVSRSKAR